MALFERSTGMTVASALSGRATSEPLRPYLLHRGEIITAGKVETHAEALASALSELGVEAGDRIALLLPPCPEFVVSMFAAAKIGAQIVPLSPRLTQGELHYVLRHSEAVCAITIETFEDVAFLEVFEELLPQLPALQYLATVGEEDLWYDDRIFQFEDLVSSGAGRDYAAPSVDPARDPFVLFYISGTIGKPRGVELSHQNLLSAAFGSAEAIGLGPDDRIAGLSALSHVFGIGPGLLSTLVSGASIVLHEDTGLSGVLGDVERSRATVYYGTPSSLAEALRRASEPGSPDLSSLRIALVAGAPAPDELVAGIARQLGVTVLNAYSLTETGSIVCVSRPGDAETKRRFTVGRPLGAMEIRILEQDGTELPVESVGEVAVRGPGVMLGYYRQPNATAAVLDPEGFLLTGDLGLIDEEGYLHLVGRRKDVIIRAGFNVYPRELEARVESHPAVREVAVVGIPDPVLGEAICACVVPVEGAIVTEREVQDWCREVLAADKVPDFVEFLGELPLTDAGKVHRVDLARAVRYRARSAPEGPQRSR